MRGFRDATILLLLLTACETYTFDNPLELDQDGDGVVGAYDCFDNDPSLTRSCIVGEACRWASQCSTGLCIDGSCRCTNAKLTGEACDECVDSHYAPPTCTTCAVRFTGSECRECASPDVVFGPDCDKCVRPGFASPNCTGCQLGLMGEECDQCVDSHRAAPDCLACLPRFQGSDCSECANPHFLAPDCVACLPNYEGPECAECLDDRRVPPECDMCVPAFAGDDCSECANPHLAAPDCETCLPAFQGLNCEQCVESHFAPPDCTQCLELFKGPTCDECARPGFAAPYCVTCLPGLKGDDCDECINPLKAAPDCTECIDGHYAPPDCSTCAGLFTGADCDQCADPRRDPPSCEECLPVYAGSDCESCANPGFALPTCTSCQEVLTGILCDSCVKPRRAPPECVSCLPEFAGDDCGECADPHRALPSCTDCLPLFKGADCDLCTDDHMTLPGCSTCLPQYDGEDCSVCSNPHMLFPGCNQCSPAYTGPACQSCSIPHHLPPDCEACESPWSGANCEVCVPDCEGRTCGIDGCGGECGVCSGSTPYCYQGSCSACEAESPFCFSDPRVLEIGTEPLGSPFEVREAPSGGYIGFSTAYSDETQSEQLGVLRWDASGALLSANAVPDPGANYFVQTTAAKMARNGDPIVGLNAIDDTVDFLGRIDGDDAWIFLKEIRPEEFGVSEVTLVDLIEARNGDLVVLAELWTDPSKFEVLLLRYASVGDRIWAKRLAPYPATMSSARSVIETADGGFVVVGHGWSDQFQWAGFFAQKTDGSGAIVWTTIEKLPCGDAGWGNVAVEAPSGQIIVEGYGVAFVRLSPEGAIERLVCSDSLGSNAGYSIGTLALDSHDRVISIGNANNSASTSVRVFDIDGSLLALKNLRVGTWGIGRNYYNLSPIGLVRADPFRIATLTYYGGPSSSIAIFDLDDCTADHACDDGNPCTTDVCIPGSGCSNEFVPGGLCGACEHDFDCDDGNPCSADDCTPWAEAYPEYGIPVCGHRPWDGEGQACVGGDMCNRGICAADWEVSPPTSACQEVEACDDSDPCTLDSCDPVQGCAHEDLAACCTQNLDCRDGAPETLDRCDGASHECQHDPCVSDCSGGACSDDGCGATCGPCPTCGNGVVDTGESCDDGKNGDDADGCRNDCRYACSDWARDCADSNPRDCWLPSCLALDSGFVCESETGSTVASVGTLCLGGQCDESGACRRSPALDISSWKLLQLSSFRDYTFDSGVRLEPGGYVIVARNAAREEFQEYWNVSLDASVIFVDSKGSFPVINGGERFALWLNQGYLADGLTPGDLVVPGTSCQRATAFPYGASEVDWICGQASGATPGSSGPEYRTGNILLTEIADATDARFEFVELFYAAP